MTRIRWTRTMHLGKARYTSDCGRFEIRARRLAGGSHDWLLSVDGKPAPGSDRSHDLLADAKDIAEEYARGDV